MSSPFGSNPFDFNRPPNTNTQLVPLQTTNTYVPVSTSSNNRNIPIPIPSSQSSRYIPTPLSSSQSSGNIPRASGTIPRIPPLATRPITPPRSSALDRDFQTNIALRESMSQPSLSPRSSPLNQDIQMNMAIRESMNQPSLPSVISPRVDRYYTPTPLQEDEDLEEVLLQEAIKLSLEASSHAKTANYHASQASSPQILSPRRSTYSPPASLLIEQDREYEESLRQDRLRQAEVNKAAEAAMAASKAAEEAARLVQVAKEREKMERLQHTPPVLKYAIENSDVGDILYLRFRLPTGHTVNHTFNRYEPLRSVMQQLRFDMKTNDKFTLSIPPRTMITCDNDSTLLQCGIENRTMINVL